MNFLKSLSTRKTQLENEIAVRRAVALSAESALVLCDQLEANLPAAITSIREARSEPHASAYSAPDDYTGKSDLVAQAHAIGAAKRLIEDLPAIRAHWKNVSENLS